jgi:glycine cleavage system H protein
MTDNQAKDDRKYTKDHEWAKRVDGHYRFGITAFAVEQLGDITLVGLDVAVGDTVTVGRTFGTIESVKTLSDLYAPMSGKVVAINQNLEVAPELINEDPWEKGWMIAIEPADTAGDLANMMDMNDYLAHVASSDH